MALSLNLDPFADSLSEASSERSAGVVIRDGEPIIRSVPAHPEHPVRLVKGFIVDSESSNIPSLHAPRVWPQADSSTIERSVRMRDQVYKQYKEIYAKLTGSPNYYEMFGSDGKHMNIPVDLPILIPPMEESAAAEITSRKASSKPSLASSPLSNVTDSALHQRESAESSQKLPAEAPPLEPSPTGKSSLSFESPARGVYESTRGGKLPLPTAATPIAQATHLTPALEPIYPQQPLASEQLLVDISPALTTRALVRAEGSSAAADGGDLLLDWRALAVTPGDEAVEAKPAVADGASQTIQGSESHRRKNRPSEGRMQTRYSETESVSSSSRDDGGQDRRGGERSNRHRRGYTASYPTGRGARDRKSRRDRIVTSEDVSMDSSGAWEGEGFESHNEKSQSSAERGSHTSEDSKGKSQDSRSNRAPRFSPQFSDEEPVLSQTRGGRGLRRNRKLVAQTSQLKVADAGNFFFSVNVDRPLNVSYKSSDFNLKTGNFLKRARRAKPAPLPASPAKPAAQPLTQVYYHQPPNPPLPPASLDAQPGDRSGDRSGDRFVPKIGSYFQQLPPVTVTSNHTEALLSPKGLVAAASPTDTAAVAAVAVPSGSSRKSEVKLNTQSLRNLVESLLLFEGPGKQTETVPAPSSAAASCDPLRMTIRAVDHTMYSYRFRIDSVRQELGASFGVLGFSLSAAPNFTQKLKFEGNCSPRVFSTGDVFTVIVIIQPSPIRL